MTPRRTFLKRVGAAAAGALLAPGAWAAPGEPHLVILHTNDTHSRIEPFPGGSGDLSGLGGVARRAALVERVRRAHPHVLLLDSGDIFQGTPYYNLYGGEVELRAMSAMRYDFGTLGNHEFDNGVGGLVEVLPHASFPILNANYDFSGAPALGALVRPWAVRTLGGVRVGLFGLGVAFERLVLPALHEGVVYRDPIGVAREVVGELRGAQRCDYVVCLSHLGFRYDEPGAVDDVALAAAVPGLDLVLGGHTHTFLDAPLEVPHAHAAPTLVHQVGWGGVRLGRVDIRFGRGGVAASGVSVPVGAA